MASERPLAGQVWLTARASRRVLQALTAHGKPARFVGGCVRDGLLGLDSGDLDLATPEPPGEVIRLLEGAGLKAIPTGLDHGTVSVVVEGRRLEITTLRRDVATDGRHATVAFTDDFEADAARRDFTINAMNCDGKGRLYDYFGGRGDLSAGRIRFVGPAAQRIAEDHLRILRFFRFFAHYGRPPPDPEALRACADAAASIEGLSGERIQAEIVKLLKATDPLPALGLMAQTGVLARVVPGVPALNRLARLLTFVPGADPLLRLGALLRGQTEAAERVALRWRLSSRDAARLLALAGDALPPLRVTTAIRRQALHRMGAERYAELVRLAAADDMSGDAAAALAEALAERNRWRPKILPITGHDVLALGVPAGPAVGEILAKIEDWWIERDFRPGRAACLNRAKRLLKDRGDHA